MTVLWTTVYLLLLIEVGLLLVSFTSIDNSLFYHCSLQAILMEM